MSLSQGTVGMLMKCVCVLTALVVLYGSYRYVMDGPVYQTFLFPRVSQRPPTTTIITTTEKKIMSKDNGAQAGPFEIELVENEMFQGLTLQDADKLMFKYLRTFKTKCKTPMRFGKPGDGGYLICMDKGIAPEEGNCLVYSFGIRNEWSFDDDVHDRLKCEVHSFDPSMNKDDHQRKEKLFFHNLGIWDRVYTNDMGWNLTGLQDIIDRLGHNNRVIDYMKIDIEGAEWPMLKEMLEKHSSLNVKQMVFEIHTPKLRGFNMTVLDYSTLYTGLNNLDHILGFKLWSERHTNGCCGRFAALTSRNITHTRIDVCCYELFYSNQRFL